ncbi:FAD-binding protein [Pseudocolwellia agarivorans]|uniref:FAD-binding protein n=1 Tax=Pseudocolwellia agarivorans TaxID=1911682 RepID=UPI003F8821CC
MASQINNSLSLQDAWNSGYLSGKVEVSDNSSNVFDSVIAKKTNSEINSLESFFITHQIDYEKDISLKEVTKRNNEGSCTYFCKPRTLNDLQKMVVFLNNENLDFEVIGDSSNVYFLECRKHNIIISTTKLNNFVHKDGELTCDCGLNLTKLANYCVDNGIANYEGFLGIPGTIGGAVVNNSGAFSSEISKVLKSITFLNTDNEIITLTNKDLKYKRRFSLIKSKQITGLVLTATFDVSNIVGKDVTIKQANDLVIFRRGYIDSDKISLGSVFISSTYSHLRDKYKYRLFLKKIIYFIGKQFIKKDKEKRKFNKELEFKVLGLSRFIDHCDTMNRFYWTKDTKEDIFFDYLNTLSDMSDNTLEIEIEMKGQEVDVKKYLPFYY